MQSDIWRTFAQPNGPEETEETGAKLARHPSVTGGCVVGPAVAAMKEVRRDMLTRANHFLYGPLLQS